MITRFLNMWELVWFGCCWSGSGCWSGRVFNNIYVLLRKVYK